MVEHIEKKIAVIPGDGIGPEVIKAATEVLEYLFFRRQKKLCLDYFDLGAKKYLSTGELLSEDTLARLKEYDAILLGSIGDPQVKPGILEKGILLKLRFAFDQYVNLRPAKYYPGTLSPLKSPEGIDFVVVREATEGSYTGNGGVLRKNTPQEIATETSVNTAFGVSRVVKYAFELALERNQKLCLVHKSNVLVNAGGLWSRIFFDLAKQYPTVSVEYQNIDAMTIYLATRPKDFDVIVTDNLFGDIITDEAAAVTGGIGLAASANINPESKFPSMFEPVHGSAPKIAGQGIADPIATIASLVLLLDNLDLKHESKLLSSAIDDVMRKRALMEEGVEIRTQEVARQIIEQL